MKKSPQSDQEVLPGIRSYQKERDLAVSRQVDRVMEIWKAGLSGDRLYTAVMMVICGLPVRDTRSMEPVVRKAQLGDKSWIRVTYSRKSDQVPLPYGADRTMVYFLTNKAVLQQSHILQWEHANEYMHLFGMDVDSGKNYRDVQERFFRVAYMRIMVEYLDQENQVVETWDCPLIDHSRMPARVDGEGNWKPRYSVSKMLDIDQTISFGYRFFSELKKTPVPIPLELILAADKKYRVMDYMLFLYWRCFAASSQSFIPWRYLQLQFDAADTNDRRWVQQFKLAYSILKSLPDPTNQIRVEISSAGLTIYPLPIGTAFFEGHGKLGYRKLKNED